LVGKTVALICISNCMSKTIILVGCSRPGSWAEGFYDMLIKEKHTVHLLSQKDYGKPNTTVIDWSDPVEAVKQFETLIEDITHIDLILFNQRGNNFPSTDNHFTSSAKKEFKFLHQTLEKFYDNYNTKVIIPHLMTIYALDKMDETSSVVYVSSGMGFEVPRPHHPSATGYAAECASLNQMMFGFAKCNDKKAKFAALMPIFDYNDKKQIKNVTKYIYETIMNTGINNGEFIYTD